MQSSPDANSVGLVRDNQLFLCLSLLKVAIEFISFAGYMPYAPLYDI
jgi:hypothetical protein